MKGMSNMANTLAWDSPYINHTAYILDHLEDLGLEQNEILVLLLIEFYNAQNIVVSDELISQKLKMSEEEVEEVFTSLSDKGFLSIMFKNGEVYFDISGVMGANGNGGKVSRSLIEEFEMEFKRALSTYEMSRIIELGDMYGEKRVLLALDDASVREARSVNYVETILVDWQNKNFTDEDLEEGKR